jgi:hypothetical protein
LVTRRTTLITSNPPLVLLHQELTHLLSSTKARSTSLEDMEVSATLELLSTTSTASIWRPKSGRKSSQTTTHLKVEEVTPHLLVKARSSSMVDGTLKCNSIMSCNTILKRKNGMIQIACTRFTDGTSAHTLFLPFLLGNFSFLVESKPNIKKELLEPLVNTSTQVRSLI